MPNWCQNILFVKGNPSSVQLLLDTVEDGQTKLSLNKIVTRPEELNSQPAPQRDAQQSEALLAKYGAKDWYDWSIKNWGTKWDVDATIYSDSFERFPGYSTVTEPEQRIVKFEFDSAWGPPTTAIDVLARQFPQLDIYLTYDESGCDFSGYRMYSKGECIKENEMESFSTMKFYCDPSDEIFEYFPQQE